MCHKEGCSKKNQPCDGQTCGGFWGDGGCGIKCEPPPKHKPHRFSTGVQRFLDRETPHLVPTYLPFHPEFDNLPSLRDDETVPIFDISGKSTHRIIRRIETVESRWLDSGSKNNPLTALEKQLMCMARNGISPAKEGDEDLPLEELANFKLSSSSSKQQDLSLKLARKGEKPVVTTGPTEVTHINQIPGVRVWVTKADQILAATGMEAQSHPDDPNQGGWAGGQTAVYIRFRNDGKLKYAGAGYWLAPDLSHVITSVYNGLAFKRQEQHHFVDIGIATGERTCITTPYCYPASLSPDTTTWTCKKGNIYLGNAQCYVSFRLGDIGVGHPDWVEATRDDGGMNARSQGGGPGYNRLLLIMTELLTTRILEVINRMP